MRAIKFRAWWKRDEFDIEEGLKPRMVYFDRLGYCDEYNHLRFAVAKESLEPEGNDYSNLGASIDEFSELMQFTGLRDKNGKEIYEGDIVKALTGVIGRIVFHNGAFCWTDGACHWGLIEDSAGRIVDKKVTKDLDSEVLGNIYENPELLK